MRPHEVIGKMADGVAGAAEGVVSGVIGVAEGVGGTLMNALDKPLSAVTRKEGPHRAIDRLAKGAATGLENSINRGVIGSMRIAGHAIMRALNHPAEQFGIPPDLGKIDVPKIKLFKK